MSALPGERAAYERLYSELSSSSAKADAATKLAEIAEIRQHNLESDRRWQAQRAAQQNVCPTCGR